MFGNLKNALQKATQVADKLGIDLPDIPGVTGGDASGGASDGARDGSKANTASASAPTQPVAQLAPITGRRKALLVGINYFGTKSELRGCINDVHK